MLLLERRVRLLNQAWKLWRAGEDDAIVALLERSLPEHLLFEPELAYLLARALASLARHPEAKEVSDRLADIACAEFNSSLRRQWLDLERILNFQFGDLARCEAVVRELYALSIEAGDERHELNASMTLGVIRTIRCDWDFAIESFRSGLGVAQRLAWQGMMGSLNHNLGMVYRQLGNFSAARYHFEQAIPHWEAVFAHGSVLTTQLERALVLLETGDARLAEATVRRIKAEYLTRENNRWNIAEARRVHGIILFRIGEPDAAVENFEPALAVARETKNLMLQAEILEELAVMALDSGDTARARDYMGQAAAIYNGMSAPKRADRAWSRLRSEVVASESPHSSQDYGGP